MCFDSVIYKFYCFQLHFQLFSQLLLGCSHEKYVISYLAICIYMYNTYTYMRMRVYVYMCLPALSLSGLRTPARISRLSAYRKDSACTVAAPMLPLAPITNTTGLDMMAGFVS